MSGQLKLNQNANIPDSCIAKRMMKVVIRATEVSGKEIPDFSDVDVIIPLAGDDHDPELDSVIYKSNVVGEEDNWTLEQNIIITATDEDKLVENNCLFKLLPEDVSSIFEITKSSPTTASISLSDSFTYDKLPEDSTQVTFFVEVSFKIVEIWLSHLN